MRTIRPRSPWSAIGPKRTWASALQMSAFGGKADMAFRGNPLLRSLLSVKRTWGGALHMSAFDPKRTSLPHRKMSAYDQSGQAVAVIDNLGGGKIITQRMRRAVVCEAHHIASMRSCVLFRFGIWRIGHEGYLYLRKFPLCRPAAC